ncbi:glycerophosphodiester phosphodiesterase family protein [Shimia thalassica]|uniref:glycerophosphodiester phosphodiesterase family protein n=1 Tax=Shimia thalassica TaxID=1715693 RepID=UPI002733E199|nr:glycerophosphodiester phosphodiesterase family protein [Shimia thalassica]MDP2579649.1 glycerophosphodiester phosphodiesterase family protein [Shimia thalassica]
MDSSKSIGVYEAYGLAWRLKWPFLLSNLMFNVMVTAFVAPLMALVVRMAISLSGNPALSDFDIAFFLLSPVGFGAFLLVISLVIALSVMNSAFMMAVALHDRKTGEHRFQEGLLLVLPHLPKIAVFGALLVLRVLVITLPFLIAAALIYKFRLTEFDINYYLTEHPPEFMVSVAVIGAILAVMALILLRRLLGWAVALPMVIFDGEKPRDSFAQSELRMEGNRRLLFVRLIGWAISASIGLAIAFAIVNWMAEWLIGGAAQDLGMLARMLLIFGLVWSALNLLITTIINGALCIMLMDEADWPGKAATPAETPGWVMPALIGAIVITGGVMLGAVMNLNGLKTLQDAEVIAHRGAAGARPENTMASIEKALEDKTDWVEIDVQETADGEVVVIHDSDFMKISGVDLKIWDATMADLEDIDIGSWYGPDYADQRTPTLLEVLETAKGRSKVLIELKYYGHDVMLEQRVSDIVDAAGMADSVKIMSLKYDAVQKMKALRPEWESGLLASASVGRVWELDTDFLAVNKAMLTPRLAREMKERDKDLYVWTVNDPLSMSHVLSLGATGLITDEPAMARDVIRQRAALSNTERLILTLGSLMGVDMEQKVYRDDSP